MFCTYLHSTTFHADGIGSIADFCLHSASLLTITAYLSTDMLALRSLAIASGVLRLAFLGNLPKPWYKSLPFRWSALLVVINGVMVTELLMERNRADNMPDDMKQIYGMYYMERNTYVLFALLEIISYL